MIQPPLAQIPFDQWLNLVDISLSNQKKEVRAKNLDYIMMAEAHARGVPPQAFADAVNDFPNAKELRFRRFLAYSAGTIFCIYIVAQLFIGISSLISPPSPPVATIPQQPPRAVATLGARITDVATLNFTTANGLPAKSISVGIQNTGTAPIKRVKVQLTIRGNFPTYTDETYAFFADSSRAPLMPNNVHRESAERGYIVFESVDNVNALGNVSAEIIKVE